MKKKKEKKKRAKIQAGRRLFYTLPEMPLLVCAHVQIWGSTRGLFSGSASQNLPDRVPEVQKKVDHLVSARPLRQNFSRCRLRHQVLLLDNMEFWGEKAAMGEYTAVSVCLD